MATDKPISLKLLVDKAQSRVILAESDEHFVDILLSFLTMPKGTIIRLLGKDSSAGCIENLYKSVERLDEKHFQTEACKNMLLRPLNAAGLHCENLLVNIDDVKPRMLFTCPESDCCSKETCFYFSVPDVFCSCGILMTYKDEWEKKDLQTDGDGVFVKGGFKFIVSDELGINPASSTIILSLFNKLGVNDGRNIEERILNLGRDEILNLLRSVLTSNAPLTDLCFSNTANGDGKVHNIDGISKLVPKSESDPDSGIKKLSAKLGLTKNGNKVVYMECGEDVLDILFSFLTLPLGSIIRLLDKNSSMDHADMLYGSAVDLSLQENDCIKSEECKNVLTYPYLAPFFGVKMQLLKIEEMVSGGGFSQGCYACLRTDHVPQCTHVTGKATLKELNPKSNDNTTEPGGGYAKGPCKFMVTDDLNVAPLSPACLVRTINEKGVLISDLVEMEVHIEEAQVLNLLKASLSSDSALTKVFCVKKH